MTKTIWVIGAIILVGVGIAAGLIFRDGNEPNVIAPESAKGAGLSPESVSTTDPEVATPEPIQEEIEADTSFGSGSVAVTPPAASEEESDSAIIVATLDELIAAASSYGNREIIVRGTIVTQCIRGCQFSLEDGTGVVAVELVDDALDNVLTRGSVGRQVEVRGVIEGSPRIVIVVEEPDGWQYLD